MKFRRPKRCEVTVAIVVVLGIWWWFSLPAPLFSAPTSTVIESSDGALLGAHIADDGQWRFPQPDSLPRKLRTCILLFEDRHFYQHPGVNPAAIARAVWQNIRNRRVVSGGSTITMQVMRLARKGKKRTLVQKFVEIMLALRAEISYSKDEILTLYMANAPFGSNIVGIEAAAWRLYGRRPHELTWAEAATLAVLPNAPALIYPGRRNEQLRAKRDRLLDRLSASHILSAADCSLAKAEPLPTHICPVPSAAPHLLGRAMKEYPGQRVVTSIDRHLQETVTRSVMRHLIRLKANEIHNAAVLVTEVSSGRVLAYIGNAPDMNAAHGGAVDVITAPRSSGSILKPFLYAAMQDDGLLLPRTLVPDIPTQIGGFSPQNFDLQYSGAVPASMALSRSLNIPAVRMLRDYGTARFIALLKKLQFTTLTQQPDHYGLSLILGGGEVTLWELAGAYAALGRLLLRYENDYGTSYRTDFRHPDYRLVPEPKSLPQPPPVSAAAAWLTLAALLDVNRPDDETGWQSFASARKIAWKTGTSFGFRDAWAVGLTRNWVVAVWCGNADGEGRPGLVGASAAAPILFETFSYLPRSSWFACPHDELLLLPVCRQSGCRSGPNCPDIDSVYVAEKGAMAPTCPYHTLIHLDSTRTWQVTSECVPVEQMIHEPWFVLPPIMEWYYRRTHPWYRPLPPFRPDCHYPVQTMDMIYPRENNKVFIPVQLDGSPGHVILEAAHSSASAVIFWHLDDLYIGQTSGRHQMPVQPSPGRHTLTLIDNSGNRFSKAIIVAEKN
ncbi:MAG: penicillin-binding protein 1C [Bacteroidales bacterium]|jgi:penicillin-binding protein 1C|nr:penicillin-binding protein 1C [Bacteroidales bacterium]